jgi:hypothetical protein
MTDLRYHPSAMKRLVRLLLLVLLALAVPAQAGLALAAAQCRVFGHHQGERAGSDHGHPAGTAHDHAGSMQHGDAAAIDQSHGDLHHDGVDASASEGTPAAGGSGCGPCAGCCASAAISGPVELPLALFVSAPPLVLPEHRPLDAGPSRLERPPLFL